MNRFDVRTVALGGVLLLALMAIAPPAGAFSTPVTVNTSAAVGEQADIFFDMYGTTNTVTISDLTGDFTSPSETVNSGSVTGSLTSTPYGISLFGSSTTDAEDELVVTLGSSLSFQLQVTSPVTPIPPQGYPGVPDEFSFYISDPNSGASLLPTSDTYGGSLFTLDIPNDNPYLTNYSLPVDPSDPKSMATVQFTSPVPNPPAFWMFLIALPVLLFCTRLRQQSRERVAVVWSTRAVIALLVAVSANLAQAQTVVTGVGLDQNISVGIGGFRPNHATKTLVTVASITNNSPFTINGPFYLGVISTSIPGITLNGTGNLSNGNPYSAVAATSIAPGQTVTAPLSFNDPSNVVFAVNAAIYDAASAPPTATLTCPLIGGAVSYPNAPLPPIVYSNPTDSLGRVASCTPVSGTVPTAAGPTALSCISGGGLSPPASCTSPYFTILGEGTITVNIPPTPTPPLAVYTGLIPCASLAAAFAPGSDGYGYALNNVNYASYCNPFAGSFHPVANGSATFTVWNYGLYDVKNATVLFYSPPGITHTAVAFSPNSFTVTGTGGSCSPPTAYNQPGATTPGTLTSCQINDIPPNAGVDVGIGVDTSTGSVPNVSAQLVLDPTQNTNTDTTNTSIQLIPASSAAVSVQVPESIGVQSKTTCNFSHEPGFAILLDTCGVPPLVTTILVSTILGAATFVDVFGDAALEVTTISETTIFKWVDPSEFDNIR